LWQCLETSEGDWHSVVLYVGNKLNEEIIFPSKVHDVVGFFASHSTFTTQTARGIFFIPEGISDEEVYGTARSL